MTYFVPMHAYVPGETPRHPDGTFDPVCASVRPGMSPVELVQSDAWRSGLWYLDSGYFWEAHEVLEPVWMALPKGSDEGLMVQALIHLANARLKRRMGREKAVARLNQMAMDVLTELPDRPVMGVHPDGLFRNIKAEGQQICEL